MHPTDKAARVAGAVYLSMVFTAPFALIYIPNTLIVRGNATATAEKILAHEMLFRLGMVADMVSSVIFICLAIALYRLFCEVSKTQASLMVGLVLVSAAVGFLNVLNNMAALTLFRGGEFLGVMDKTQREALGMLFIRLHGQGNVINELFWGLWLLPFGMLVIKSRFLPRILGAWLIVNGLAYMAICLTGMLWPPYMSKVNDLLFPVLFGELAIMLWLLIKGASQSAISRQPSAAR